MDLPFPECMNVYACVYECECMCVWMCVHVCMNVCACVHMYGVCTWGHGLLFIVYSNPTKWHYYISNGLSVSYGKPVFGCMRTLQCNNSRSAYVNLPLSWRRREDHKIHHATIQQCWILTLETSYRVHRSLLFPVQCHASFAMSFHLPETVGSPHFPLQVDPAQIK